MTFIGDSCFPIEATFSGALVMAFIRDPLFVVWEAMNLIIEADVCPDAPHVSKLIAEAEEALLRLTIELARRAELESRFSRLANVALH